MNQKMNALRRKQAVLQIGSMRVQSLELEGMWPHFVPRGESEHIAYIPLYQEGMCSQKVLIQDGLSSDSCKVKVSTATGQACSPSSQLHFSIRRLQRSLLIQMKTKL